ncbi:hypothetical protein H0H81_001722 [Sphagnurus paluster]|uniref:DUF5648 domain-containing protein n=1 Tax=Sphagnurus paluster TaxID=117069 RepID=A0A9P7FW00_9AGAR|nr:hypothetical protein H0H81_001722 [Sphagnurus paluster]
MKFSILALAVLTGCAAAAVLLDVGTYDGGVDVDVIGELKRAVKTVDPKGMGNGSPGQPGQPGQPGTSGTRKCPSRKQASPWIRRGSFPFSTTRIVGFFFSFNGYNTTAVFFLFNSRNSDYFYTTSTNERNNAIAHLGYQDKGTIGFIFIDQRCGGSPLYRLYDSRKKQHFYTASQSDRSSAKRNGWTDEGVMGYLFSP